MAPKSAKPAVANPFNDLPSRNPTQAPAPKEQNRKQDLKSLLLEQEFKTKHFGVLGVLFWIL